MAGDGNLYREGKEGGDRKVVNWARYLSIGLLYEYVLWAHFFLSFFF
jgi:hypothetical protein